jgi:hypothetical protein
MGQLHRQSSIHALCEALYAFAHKLDLAYPDRL